VNTREKAEFVEHDQRSATAESLVRLLDDGLKIPGTRIRIGLDPVLGLLLPAVGDALAGFVALTLLHFALQRRVPKVVIARMVLNTAIDAVIGSIPILGDLFDVYFKANRRNLQLIQRFDKQESGKASAGDYLFVTVAALAILILISLPFVVAYSIYKLM